MEGEKPACKMPERIVNMREEIQPSGTETKTGKGRKVCIGFGILLIALGVFLGSFTCSFQVMIESAKTAGVAENSLESENTKLKEEVQLLQDKVEILEAELTRYQKEEAARPTASSTAKPQNKPSTSGTTNEGSTATKKPVATKTPTATPKPTQSATKKPSTELVE